MSATTDADVPGEGIADGHLSPPPDVSTAGQTPESGASGDAKQLTSMITSGNIAMTSTTKTAIATTATTTTTTGTATVSTSAPATVGSSFPFAIYYLISFRHVCIVTAVLPLVTLFTCFVTAYVFQYDEVHETHCRVYNVIPSISAITGVSPQRYFWRFSIALHIGPRIPIAFVYKNYHRALWTELRRRAGAEAVAVRRANILIHLAFLLNCVEVLSLAGVTYISNRENYPVHERIFITFMTCSLCHMLATIKLHGLLHPEPRHLTQQQRDSIKWKKNLFAASILSTVGLLIFFAKHRFYCHDLAFSWFAFFEYLIAIANMLFHFTIIWDFPSQYVIIVQGSHTALADLFNVPPKATKFD